MWNGWLKFYPGKEDGRSEFDSPTVRCITVVKFGMNERRGDDSVKVN